MRFMEPSFSGIEGLIDAVKGMPSGDGYKYISGVIQVYAWGKIQAVHHLKTLPPYFQEVMDDRKKFELRNLKDRDFQVGHFLCLWEYAGAEYTDRAVLAAVPYILRDVPEYGLAEGCGIMSLEIVAKRGLEG